MLLRTILKNKLEASMARNSQYSLRKLSQDLGVSSGSLVDFFKGRRNFSADKIEEILDKLKLSGKDREDFNRLPLNAPLMLANQQLNIQIHQDDIEKLLVLIESFNSKLRRLSREGSGEIEVSIDITTPSLPFNGDKKHE